MQAVDRLICAGCRDDGRALWQRLVLTDLVYKIIAVVIIAPVVGLLFRVFIWLSGREFLADEEILRFAVTPIGVAATIIVGAVSVGTLAFEQAALASIIFAHGNGRSASVRQALLFTASKAFPVLWVTARLIGLVLVVSAPFLAVAGIVYARYLTEFDINYYLREQPPVFVVCLLVAAALIVGLTAVVVPLLVARSMALPLLLFENIPAKSALAMSRQRTTGHRLRITCWLVVWAGANFLLSGLLTGTVAWMAGRLIRPSSQSINVVLVAVGVVLALWVTINFVMILFGAISFSLILTNLYRRLSMAASITLPTSFEPITQRGQQLLQLTRKTLAVGAVIALLVSLSLSVWCVHYLDVDDQSAIMAHRGASAAAPENTLASVRAAIDARADWVEIDVQESSDGVAVVVHDSDLKKLGGSGEKIWELTADQLRTTDIGSWFDARFKDERVPTLDEVLELCKNKIRVNIELKYYGHEQQLEARVIERVEAHDMGDDVIIMSLKKSGIDRFKQLQPNWPAGLLTATAVGDLTNVQADFLAVSTSLATGSFVRRAHSRGRRVFVWTVNDPATMSIMMARGVDAIITDKPALARAVQEERMKMSPIERLLFLVAALIGSTDLPSLTIDDV